MASNVSEDGKGPKRITANGGRLEMVTPTTLARMEDPRAWHVKGWAGRVQPGNHGAEAVALPMAPPLPKGRSVPVTKTILEEEDYVDCLEKIIEGDYFPNNAKMYRAIVGLAKHGHGNTPSHTPSTVATPSPMNGLPTPGGSISGRRRELGASGNGSGGTSSSKDAGMGGALTKFVATYTSEDNQAFAELQEKDQEAFRRRHFWAYDTTPDGEGDNATATKLLILPNGKMMSVERRKQMDAACADRPKIGDHRPNQVETWKHRTRNQLMFSPNLATSNDVCRIDQGPAVAAPLLVKDGSPSSIATTKQRVIKQSEEVVKSVTRAAAVANQREDSAEAEDVSSDSGAAASAVAAAGSDSSPPSRDEPVCATSEQRRQGGAAKNSAGPSKEGGGGTAKTTTDEPLLPTPCVDSDSDDIDGSSGSPVKRSPAPRRPSPSVSRGAVVVKTNPKVIQAHATRFPVPAPRQPRRGPWASPIEKPSSSRESVVELLAGTVDASGHEEVPMTPSRVPGVDGDSPQITWGSIDGTPMILDPRATPLPESGGTTDAASFIGTLGGIGMFGRQQFEVKDLPARDKLAHRLEAVDTRRKRAKLGVGATAGGRGAHTSAPATLLTPQTPRTGQRTPGTGKRTPGGGRTLGKVKAAATTPAARTLAAKLAQRHRADTPFGGGLTPGRQKRRTSRLGSGNGPIRDGLTPLPSTPVAANRKSAAAEGRRSTLTDGLLALK